MSDLKITQQEVARRLGKSRPYIANMLRLLHLPSAIMKMVREGELSGTWPHLIILKGRSFNEKGGKEAVRESWSVRQLEQYVNTYLKKASRMQNQSKRTIKTEIYSTTGKVT